MAVHVLSTPVMTAREAARQLGLPPTTLIHWLEGGERRGQRYEPVLRPAPLGHQDMTWGEIVESQYLRAYRSHVSLQRLRPFIREMREAFGVPYPLAHYRPYLDENRSLVVDLQEKADVPDSLLLVMSGRHRGQYLLNPLVQSEFLHRVEFAETGDRAAQRLRPNGKASPVVIDPEFSSGAATVQGIRTEVLAGLVVGGEHIDDVAAEFSLTVRDVREACAYEWGKPQQAA
jgi:uncharacterized protein (DUF433 family)